MRGQDAPCEALRAGKPLSKAGEKGRGTISRVDGGFLVQVVPLKGEKHQRKFSQAEAALFWLYDQVNLRRPSWTR
jgi:hypothetical protein